MDEQKMAELINGVKWIYSKTYPWCPHEYTVFEWEPEKMAQFREFTHHIKEHGGWEPFMKRRTWYFRFGEMKYWIMDSPDRCTLINRTFIDDDRVKKIHDVVNGDAFIFKKGMSLASIEQEYC